MGTTWSLSRGACGLVQSEKSARNGPGKQDEVGVRAAATARIAGLLNVLPAWPCPPNGE